LTTTSAQLSVALRVVPSCRSELRRSSTSVSLACWVAGVTEEDDAGHARRFQSRSVVQAGVPSCRFIPEHYGRVAGELPACFCSCLLPA
jgi:hypothetical protein